MPRGSVDHEVEYVANKSWEESCCAKTPRQKHIELSRPRRCSDAGHFSEFDYACIAAISDWVPMIFMTRVML
jgi:hypothetical protein